MQRYYIQHTSYIKCIIYHYIMLFFTYPIDCGYVAHKQCKDCTVADCMPTKQLIKRSEFTVSVCVCLIA